MEHNDATNENLPADPDATEIVPVDVEAMLHMELDASIAEKKASRARIPTPRPAAGRPAKESIATIRAMRAAPRASTRMSARMPVPSSSRVPLPRPPIHTLLPPRRIEEDDDDVPTSFYDRKSGRSSLPSVKSVAFPAPTFSAPRAPQPFQTVPAIPVAKRAVPTPDDSQATSVQPVLAPTSRRDLRIPGVMESLAPMAMSAFPSAPPPAPKRLSVSSMFAIMLTMIFTLGSVAVMGVGVFKPSALDWARTAMKGNQQHHPVAAAKAAEPVDSPVPPVLMLEESKDAGASRTAP